MKALIVKLLAARPTHIGLIFVLLTGLSSAQDSVLMLSEGVKPHAGIDAIYTSFSEGYRTFDAELVANLYTVDAAYLSPGREVRNGRDEIMKGFARSFESTKARGRTMTISFLILQRGVANDLGYDVGVYRLEYFENGKSVHRSKGKFVVVAVRERDGEWRFQVDGYSNIDPPDSN